MAISERDKYVAMWKLDAYRSHSPGERYVDEALQGLIKDWSSVIDFGCGTGRAAAKIALSCSVLAIDFAPNCLDDGISVPFLVADLTQLPELSADYGFCTDVMEHIPTDMVDAVLSGIARSVKSAFFAIDLHNDAAGRLIGERLHMTVQPAAWWIEKIKQHFSEVQCEDRGYSLVGICRR